MDRLDAVDRRYRHALRRFAAGLVGDYGRADEIVQESLVKLWQRPGLLDEPVRGIGAWLFTVTRNLAYDELRCAQRRHEFATDIGARFDRGLDDPCAGLADTWIVQRALATLSYQHREVIVHAYYRRATINDIASELAIPPGTVKSRLYYALRALRDACIAQGVTDGY
ncbi:sigma-70 family RNA polymerase sigma factor [Nocardia sp. NEAU-G5]|uniref:Sigma-70 family RNA polymerase sigma factor n=1 Tax=Nocardia albiluteola TaxID=2842303 RepID=A0ABS6B9X7_9NOCA|nr:sigma-70 family RNA polymerase sigma factor [Nocardia albiluteola]